MEQTVLNLKTAKLPKARLSSIRPSAAVDKLLVTQLVIIISLLRTESTLNCSQNSGTFFYFDIACSYVRGCKVFFNFEKKP